MIAVGHITNEEGAQEASKNLEPGQDKFDSILQKGGIN